MENRKFKRWQMRIILCSAIGYAFFYLTRKNLSVAMPDMLTDLGTTKATLGIYLTLHGVIYGTSRFVNGFWADRVNARIFMVLGLILSALANVFFGCSSLAWTLGLFWVLNGWTQGMGFPPCTKILTHWIHPRELATKMAMWNTSHSFGAVMALALCGFLVTVHNWTPSLNDGIENQTVGVSGTWKTEQKGDVSAVVSPGLKKGATADLSISEIKGAGTLSFAVSMGGVMDEQEPSRLQLLDGKKVLGEWTAGSSDAVCSNVFADAGTHVLRLKFTQGTDTNVHARVSSLVWDPQNCSLHTAKVSSNVDGAGLIGGGGRYAEGTQLKLKADPRPDWVFDGWYEGESLLSRESSPMFVLEKDCDLQARFSPRPADDTIWGRCVRWYAGIPGWRLCFIVPAVLALIAALFTWITVRDTPSDVGLRELDVKTGEGTVPSIALSAEEEKESARRRYRLVFRNKVIWLCAIANFFVYIVRFGFLDWGCTFLKEYKGIPVSKGAWMTIAFELAAVVGTIFAGWATDRVFKGRGVRTCVFCMVFAALFSFAFWYLPEGAPIWQATLLLMGAGFCIYGPQALIGIVAANQATKEAAALATGFTGILGYLSTFVSGYGLGKISDMFGWGPALCSIAAFALVGMILFLLAWNERATGYASETSK